MSPQPSSEQLAALRRDAQLLLEQTSVQEDQLKALAASAERDVRHAEAALAHAPDAVLGHVQNLLAAQVQRSTAEAEAARRLCVGAHQQQTAARRLLAHLTGDFRPAEREPRAVLVVDDYRDIREVLAYVLQDAGFVVRTASNGLEALIAAYDMRPGVIVMDVTMPVLDGIEATRLIKAGDVTRDAQVIAYTGNPSVAAGLDPALFAAVLQKPAPPAVVLATVQHFAGL